MCMSTGYIAVWCCSRWADLWDSFDCFPSSLPPTNSIRLYPGLCSFCPATLLCLLSFCLLFLTLLGMPFALYALLHFPAFLPSRFWFLPLKPRESFFIVFSDALNLPSSSLPLGCCYRFWRSPSSFPFRIFRNVSADRVETRMQICRYLQ